MQPSQGIRLDRATADLDPPFAVVDLAALASNTDDLVRRAGGLPIRVASKSVRCRSIIASTLARPGFDGVLALTLPEALWLAGDQAGDQGSDQGDVEDVVVGYPSADRGALRRLAADVVLAERVTLMVDSVETLEFTAGVVGPADPGAPPLRVCLELDASLRLLGGRLHLGPRRSPVHSVAEARALAEAIVAHPRFELVGMMAYEGQIAGLGDDQPGSPLKRLGVRTVQRTSARELAERRAEAVAAVREVAPLEFVNGGGTGSLELTSAEAAVTEVAAGSGLFAPALFDHYTAFAPQPAALFATAVVRHPAPGIVTVQGGGWVASGPTGRDRLPEPTWPPGLAMLAAEGAGEAQTPLAGPAADGLRIGDRVWFRHAKAGELCERVDELHLVDGDRVVDVVPTYRGEGHAFL